jgi:hypothetical protein
MASLFSEVKNIHYEIEPIKMTNDAVLKGTYPPLPTQYNFFMLLVGKPGSGKTTLWLNLINKKDKDTFYKKFDRVFIFSNSIQTISDTILLPKEQILLGIDELANVLEMIKAKEDEKVLLILDDLMSDIKDTSTMMKIIANRRHIGGGLSIIITTQVFNRIPLAIRKMASDLIFFATTNKKEIDSIFSDYSSLPKSSFIALMNHVFKKGNHEFLWLKVESETYYHNYNKIKFCSEESHVS